MRAPTIDGEIQSGLKQAKRKLASIGLSSGADVFSLDSSRRELGGLQIMKEGMKYRHSLSIPPPWTGPFTHARTLLGPKSRGLISVTIYRNIQEVLKLFLFLSPLRVNKSPDGGNFYGKPESISVPLGRARLVKSQ